MDVTYDQNDYIPGYNRPSKTDNSIIHPNICNNAGRNTSTYNNDKSQQKSQQKLLFDSRKSSRIETCEVDRSIARRKHRREDNDTLNKTSYETCLLSSSDDTSKKRKVTTDNDVSTISLTPNSTNTNAKPNVVNVSIPVSMLENTGNLAELSFTVTSNRNVNTIVSNKSKHRDKNSYSNNRNKKCNNKMLKMNDISENTINRPADMSKAE